MCPSRQRGITLIEILVTLAIVGLMLAVAVPSFGRYLEGAAFRGKTEEVGRDIARLRITALVDQQVLFFPQTDENGNTTYAGLSQPLPQGWVIEGQSIGFFDRGACSGGALSIQSPSGRTAILDFKAPFCRYGESRS